MDAVTYLRREHWEMDGLLNRLDGEQERRRDLLRRLRARLSAHRSIEERVLVPALSDCAEAGALDRSVNDVYQDYEELMQLIDELLAQSPGDPAWNVKFQQVKEHVWRHALAEEIELFPLAVDLLPESKLKALGVQMGAAAAECEGQDFALDVPLVMNPGEPGSNLF